MISISIELNALRFHDAWQECCTHLIHARHALKSMEAHLPLDGRNGTRTCWMRVHVKSRKDARFLYPGRTVSVGCEIALQERS